MELPEDRAPRTRALQALPDPACALLSALMVAGGIVIAVVMLLLLPVAVMLGGAIWSALMGWLLVDDAETRAGTEPS
jgi:formate hydrogenlyase subunit 3/multisubunit Na+/H+ antiporter MnhD subunit